MTKIHLVLFYSEGGAHDNGIDLTKERDIIIECASHQVDHIEFYTPRKLRELGYGDYVKEYPDSGVVSKNPGLNMIGFCAWRPLIMRLEMEKVADGDIIVYRDINCNKQPTNIYGNLKNYDYFRSVISRFFNEYVNNFDFLVVRDGDFIKTRQHCKTNVIKELAIHPEFTSEFPLLISNLLIFKKSRVSEELLNEWQSACENESWINGIIYDELDPEFKWHTPEQGILSVIISNWVFTRKHNIPEKYPDIILQWRNMHMPCRPTQYHYLDICKNVRPLEIMPTSKRGLFLFFGECFRWGGQYTKNRDSDISYEPQKRACMSHKQIIQQIETSGYEIDIAFASYETKWETDLCDWYSKKPVYSKFHSELDGQETICRSALACIDLNKYTFIQIIRIDLELKPLFIKRFNPEWSKIMFPAVCWLFAEDFKKCNRSIWNCPRIIDCSIFVPRKFFNLIKNQFYLNHDAWFYYKHHAGSYQPEMDVMIRTFHDSNTQNDWNPLYRIVGRPEANTWRSRGFIHDHTGDYDPILFEPITNSIYELYL